MSTCVQATETSTFTATASAHWARDFAIVGGVSSFLAPFLVSGTLLGWPTLLGTTAAGALTGAFLGALLRGATREWLGSTPWPLLALLFLSIGATWGAAVGALGAVVLTIGAGDAGAFGPGGVEVALVFMGCAAVAGAAQLAWFGVSYARAERVGRPTWPLLVAACGTPFLGWAAIVFVAPGLSLGGVGWGIR